MALREEGVYPKEVRTNDGRAYHAGGVEQWALGSGRLVILEGAGQVTLAIRNIASIGASRGRRRRRA